MFSLNGSRRLPLKLSGTVSQAVTAYQELLSTSSRRPLLRRLDRCRAAVTVTVVSNRARGSHPGVGQAGSLSHSPRAQNCGGNFD